MGAAENAKDSIELEMVWKHDGNTTVAPVTTPLPPKTTKPPHDIWDIWYADVTRLRAKVKENEKLLHLLGVLVKGNQHEIEIIENKTLNSLEAEIKELKEDDARLEAEIEELKNDTHKQEQDIKNPTVDLNELKNDTEQDIKELKTDDDKQGKTIKNITANLKELITEDVKQDKAISNLTVDIKELKTEDDKQDKAISNLTVQNNKLKEELKVLKTDDVKLNKRVDELERKGSQIGAKSLWTNKKDGIKGYVSRHERDVHDLDITFDKSFSAKPEVMLSTGGFIFKHKGRLDGWAVY